MLLTRKPSASPPPIRPLRPRRWSPAWRAASAAPCRRWTGAPSCAAPASASASASPPRSSRWSRRPRPPMPAAAADKPVVRRTVCSHCSVGCAVDAVVENGVWVRQEPVFDSPINLGAHCAKGAALREHGHGEYRLKTPMKLVGGKYERISLGPGAERDQRQDARAQEAERPGLGVRRRLVEAQQRAGLPAAQVDEPVGQQQLRPPGAHLPLHHGRGRREHVGLRRDDELVQRHAQLQVRDVHRLERRRGASGVDAAHAARQGNRLPR